MPDDLILLSANLGRRHSALETLLQSSPAHILLIQEPSWVSLVPEHSDSDPTGIPVYGTARHRDWVAFLPPPSPDRPRVATFIRSSLVRSWAITTYPPFSSYTGLGLIVTLPDHTDPILLLNFYHHVMDHSPRLFPLFSLPSSLHIPTFLFGDFNTHFPQWSPPDARPSPWASSLDNWLNNEDLTSLVPPGSITRVSGASRGSLIDFIFANDRAFSSFPVPSHCSISFTYTASPDHAGLLLQLPLSHTLIPPRPRKGWVVSPSKREDWEA